MTLDEMKCQESGWFFDAKSLASCQDVNSKEFLENQNRLKLENMWSLLKFDVSEIINSNILKSRQSYFQWINWAVLYTWRLLVLALNAPFYFSRHTLLFQFIFYQLTFFFVWKFEFVFPWKRVVNNSLFTISRNSLLNKSSPELVEDVKMLTRPGIRVDHTYYLFLL